MAPESKERRRLNIKLPRSVLDAVSGALAGGVARMAVSPLDVLKIRFQVQLEPIHAPSTSQSLSGNVRSARMPKYTGLMQATKDIFREEGILGFWRGTVPGLLLVMPYTAIQFVVIHKCKTFLAGSSQGQDHKRLRPELSFGVGAVAGVAATIGSYPFDLLRTVLASQGEPKVYSGMISAARGIVQQQGVPGLFSGLSPTIAEIIPYAGLQYGLYDVFKHSLLAVKTARHKAEASLQNPGSLVAQPEHQGAHPAHESMGEVVLDPLTKFFCGLAAGIGAKAVCHPLDVVKKRFQVAGLARSAKYGAQVHLHEYRGMVDALRKIVAKEGVEGLYKGLLPSLIKAAPAAAITFFVYELVSKRLEALSEGKE